MNQHSDCPFCGCSPEHIHICYGEEIVRCTAGPDGCPAGGVYGDTENEAWAKWEWLVKTAPIWRKD